jgi:hypothetical protein
MKQIAFLTAVFILAGCGSRPPAQQAQQQMPVAGQPAQPANPAPVVVAQQPYPMQPGGVQQQQAAAQQQQAAAQPPGVQPPEVPGQPAQQPAIAIPGGTAIRVRLNQALDTRRNRAGDRFTATLVDPIREQGRVVVPRGVTFSGHVTSSSASGRLKGRAAMGLTLDSFEIKGARYPVVTTSAGRVSARHKKRNLVLIGGGSGLGALIGGLAGGGKGALIGAGAGAGAGTAGAALTGKKELHIPAETLLTFRLEESVEL